MELIFELSNNALVAALFGELDHHGAEKVRKDIEDAMQNYGSRHLVLDFTKVTFMDSAGIGLVLGRYKKLQERGGKLVLTACDKRVRGILHMAGVFSLVPYTDTKEEALAYLEREEES